VASCSITAPFYLALRRCIVDIYDYYDNYHNYYNNAKNISQTSTNKNQIDK